MTEKQPLSEAAIQEIKQQAEHLAMIMLSKHAATKGVGIVYAIYWILGWCGLYITHHSWAIYFGVGTIIAHILMQINIFAGLCAIGLLIADTFFIPTGLMWIFAKQYSSQWAIIGMSILAYMVISAIRLYGKVALGLSIKNLVLFKEQYPEIFKVEEELNTK